MGGSAWNTWKMSEYASTRNRRSLAALADMAMAIRASGAARPAGGLHGGGATARGGSGTFRENQAAGGVGPPCDHRRAADRALHRWRLTGSGRSPPLSIPGAG